jgi:D-alanine-D-alanine ligase
MTIGVFFGSRSPEHDISIITGQLIISGLKKLGLPVVPVYLDKTGQWMLGEQLGQLKSFTAKELDFSKHKAYILDLENSKGKLVFKEKGVFGKTITIDLAFPALHGANGEDGTIQGLFEMFNVPYVGCDVTASAIAINKSLTKKILSTAGIPTAPFKSFTRKTWDNTKASILPELETVITYPMMVKPPMLGSSIGIAKVTNQIELEQAIETAFYYGNEVLIEVAVPNLIDLTCAVLGNDNPEASLIQESVISKDVFSFEDKYLKDGGAQLGKAVNSTIIPARLDSKTTDLIRRVAIESFQAIGASGIARVDFLYDSQAGKFYVSEINTLPGTLYHHLWAKSGIELDVLLTRLIKLAQESYQIKNQYATVFESDLLKMTNSIKLKQK